MTAAQLAVLLAGVTSLVGAAVAGVAAVVDLRTRRLPNRLTGAIAATALVGYPSAALVGSEALPFDRLVLGAVVFAGPWLAVHLLRPADTGFGDVKLAAALGLHLGWYDPQLGFWASLGAALGFAAVGLVFGRRRDEPHPFGPFLVAAATVAAAVTVVATGAH